VRKRKVCLIIILCLLSLIANAAGGRSVADYSVDASQTTDKVICFSGFDWNTKPSALKSFFEQQKIECNVKSEARGEPDGWTAFSSSSYGDGKIIPTVSSKYVPTRRYTFENPSYRSYAKVGGHEVFSFEAVSIYFSPYNEKLYEIEFMFRDSDYISHDEQFDDLTRKLTSLYGQPHSYTREDDVRSIYGYTTKYRFICNVWLGAEKTSVYLKRAIPLNGTDPKDDGWVVMSYGLADTSNTFVEIESEYFKAEEKKRRDAFEAYSDDFSGL